MKKRHILKATILLLLVTPVAVLAASDTQTTTITATLDSSISMTTSGSVAINVTPTASGSASSSSDTVSVSTNNSTGYNLTLKDSDTTTALTGPASNTIATHTGTFASPSTLANNSWGYRVDGAGSFGAGPTSAQTNQANLAQTWAGIVASSGSAVTLKNTSTTAAGDVTTVWYGVKADSTKINGAYTNTVSYTATTN